MKYALLLLTLTFAIFGQFFLKKGVMASTLTANLGSIIRTILSPGVIVGLTFYGLGSVIWLFVLQRFPLSVAYPALSLTYVVIVIASYFLLQEPLTATKLAGVALILGGVFLLFR